MTITTSLRITLAAAGAVALASCASQPSAPAASGPKAEVLWLGQSAIRLTTPGGKVIMIDPFLTQNPKTPAQWKNLDALGKIDLILVTHAHGDHLGDAPALSTKNNAPVIGPAGLNQSLLTLGVLPANLVPRMNKGGTITPLGPNIKITMTRAEHSSELVWRNPATGKDETHPGGEPIGYIIEMDNGFKIWHMGDTGVFGDMKLIADYYKPDVVMIPIGGTFTMDPADAAFALRELIKPKYAMPMHYRVTPGAKTPPEQLVEALGQTSTKLLLLKPGEKVEF